MKTYFIFLILIVAWAQSLAQQFETVTLINNGDIDKNINVVILSDGYTSSELSKFVVDATAFTTSFFVETPYSNYGKYFNVIIIKVPSNQSGASHPGTATDVTEPVFPVITVDNYFGSTFDAYGIHRLLVATKTSAISNVLAANFPKYDLALILVNSPYYGGSGGSVAVASTHTLSYEIAVHEIGHSFGWLKDEYWAGDVYAGEGVNMTKETNPTLVKWKNWYGTNLIGIYQHCCGGTSSQWYKPHENCKMQYLGVPFCSVCDQAIIERIHTLATPVISHYPVNLDITETNYPVKFKVKLINPVPNTLKRVWQLNGSFFKHKIDSVFVYENNLNHGTNTLTVTIEDTTQLLRIDNHASIHISTVSWSINKTTTAIKKITSSSSETIIDLYPNPTSGSTNIKFAEAVKGDTRFDIFDLQGQKILSLSNVNSIDLQSLSQGIYVVKIYVNNNLVTTRKIIKE
jgi:hypothetical protein